MSMKWIQRLFVFAGIYDGVLGLAFLTFQDGLFDAFDVQPPNNLAYIQFPALLLLVFAGLFFRVAMAPVKRRELILYGCGLKVAYCVTIFGHQAMGDISSIWIPWAWADVGLLVLFIAAYRSLGQPARAAE